MKKVLCLFLVSLLFVSWAFAAAGFSNFEKTREYADGQFSDVNVNEWYYESVKNAYELGLVNGNSDVTYNPSGNITIAETIALASRIHNIYYGNNHNFEQTDPWYQCYVDYANEKKISVPQNKSYTEEANRTEFAYIISGSVPRSALNKINNVEDIPDLESTNYAKDQIYMLYNAGVLTGSDGYGSFNPESKIMRNEVATIITRIVRPELRKTFVLEEKPNITVKPVGCSDDISYEITQASFDVYRTEYGSNFEYYAIIGIKNTGNTNIYLNGCVMDIEDKSGHLLQSDDFNSIARDYIAPGETGYFYSGIGLGGVTIDADIWSADDVNLVAYITLRRATGSVINYEVSDTAMMTDSIYGFKVTGRITNHTDKDENIYANIIFFDKNNKVIGIYGTSVSTYAGATASFEWNSFFASENLTFDKVYKYEVVAQSDYYQYD